MYGPLLRVPGAVLWNNTKFAYLGCDGTGRYIQKFKALVIIRLSAVDEYCSSIFMLSVCLNEWSQLNEKHTSRVLLQTYSER